ncbi:type I-E CRISPR-associated protein Cas5/CasD [Methanospirillum sp. J.3.6.1-F.2.7.3]|uniref:Type I-E CRISPR-associated protein Cas5/CasD n=1 Tax=Methanospirillum purgamenti TaxID=2834276 RepID=A0A8E7AWS5_9EURY|nr:MULTISPECIES: type I-E CRISPR-associated protein Cas5/CasD [Methanospirillum]MDX8551212.1 type I-E CRISPR-associated protein Cas5/CasD [Methanospirillum hungatei]QVV88180.1 type I-E CRISPR-associated protein Cas5/CasD [Methanospirillum sp. J.3.6.1-F.2.7.3]
MTQFCLINLYGPMAGYGGIAVGDMRPSWPRPSRSAVLGMVAAAFGIRRDDEEAQTKLQTGYGFSVMVLQPGIMMQDFHTIQSAHSSSVKKLNHVMTRRDEMNLGDPDTILSRREYLCDHISVACIWIRDIESAQYSLEEIADAFKKPVFCLYLGRKSCPPALPVHARVIQTDSLKSALVQHIEGFDLLYGFQIPDRVSLFFEEGIDPGFDEPVMVIKRRDNILSRSRWQFSDRNEYYARISVSEV